MSTILEGTQGYDKCREAKRKFLYISTISSGEGSAARLDDNSFGSRVQQIGAITNLLSTEN